MIVLLLISLNAQSYNGEDDKSGLGQIFASFIASYAIGKTIDHAWEMYKAHERAAQEEWRGIFNSAYYRVQTKLLEVDRRRERERRERHDRHERRDRDRWERLREIVEGNASAGTSV